MNVLDRIKQQIRAAESELRSYPPGTVDWVARSYATADHLIPWLEGVASSLRNNVEQVLNAPQRLRSMWEDIRGHINLPKQRIDAFEAQLATVKILLDHVSGELVSAIVTAYLLAEYPTSALKRQKRLP